MSGLPPAPDADFYALPDFGGFLELDVNVREIDVARTLDRHIR